MKNKTKKKINQIINAVVNDINYNKGGIMFFFTRMSINVIVMYYICQFFKLALIFAYKMQELPITDEHLEIIAPVVWASGLIYLVYRIPTMDVDEE